MESVDTGRLFHFSILLNFNTPNLPLFNSLVYKDQVIA